VSASFRARYDVPAFVSSAAYEAGFGTPDSDGADGLFFSALVFALRALAPFCELGRVAALFGYRGHDTFWLELLPLIAGEQVPAASTKQVEQARAMVAWFGQLEDEYGAFVAGDPTCTTRNVVYDLFHSVRLALPLQKVQRLCKISTCKFAAREGQQAFFLATGVTTCECTAWLLSAMVVDDRDCAVHETISRSRGGEEGEQLLYGGPVAEACSKAGDWLVLSNASDPLGEHCLMLAADFEEVLQTHADPCIDMREVFHLHSSLSPCRITLNFQSDERCRFRDSICGIQFRARQYEMLPPSG
jgi:hypothetical protein